jgi:signal transduction histidine kinase/pSer/pThr/pTyr-binding forkhead associated (FHA) protein
MNCPSCLQSLADDADRCLGCGRSLVLGRIEVVQGDTTGATRDLTPRALRIGRAWENDVCLPDASVSRFHARVYHDTGELWIEDLGSTQGVVLNGTRIERARLEDGDEMRLGGVTLRFRRHASSTDLSPQEVIEQQQVLLSVVEVLNSSRVVEEVLDQILDAVMGITKAERGFLFLSPEAAAGPGSERAEEVAGMRLWAARSRRADHALPIDVSASILKRARQGETVAVRGDTSPATGADPSPSLRNVVCLPLRSPRRRETSETPPPALGAIYLDNHLHSAPFRPDNLRAAEALGRHAALALENTRLLARLQQTIAELSRARDQAFEASRAKSLFLASMSRELHAPLEAVIERAQHLELEGVALRSSPLERDARTILDAGRHLLRVIDDVLDLANLGDGRLKLAPKEFELSRVLDEAVEEVRELASRNRNRLEVRSNPELGRVFLDPRRLRQMVTSLLGNAAKFTESGSITFEARRESPDWIRLTVTDTGVGMAPEQAANVFEAFSRSDSSPTRKFGGVGIGLAITRQLCELMGGQLSVTSEPGEGSVFTIRLPARTGTRSADGAA